MKYSTQSQIILLSLGLGALFNLSSASAAQIAGVDFEDEFGGDTTLPEDLNATDGVTVSADWTFAGGGGIPGVDNNSNTDRPTAPVRKMNGPNNTSATPPAVGSEPPLDGIHSFSVTFGEEPFQLTSVKFDFSNATGTANQRWVAFRTSLDIGIIFSQNGAARPDFPSVEIVLNDLKYQNLSNETVEFFWYCGGEGSGDIDIDSILIEGIGGPITDTDGDGMDDVFEQAIIDADPADGIDTLADVLPGDDFDNDMADNLREHEDGTNPIVPDTDADGYLDGVENNSGSFVDLTMTGTDPRNPDTDGDGLRDGVETNSGTYTDAMDTGSHPLIADTDGDLMEDGYEVANGLNPVVDDAGLDPDDDLASNLSELTNGTDPQNPDTDGDGFRDGVETNDGTFDDLLTDTGTDPLDDDTDDDGFLDGVETNDGSFDDLLTDTGTNPLLEDSDNDDFRDGVEVSIHSTDPNSAASFPNTALSVLFVGAGTTGTAGADGVAIRYIQDKYGISSVTFMEAAVSVTESTDGFDLLVISSTMGSGDVRGKFQNSLVPIVNWEEALHDNGAGEFGHCTAITIKSTTTTEIQMTDHPIGQGLPSTVVLFDAPGLQTTSTDLLFGELTSAGNEPETGNAMILPADVGEAVDPGAGIIDNIAPARRVMLPFTDATIASLTPDGFRLFGNAMDWAVGRLGSAADEMRITRIVYDDVSDPGNILVTLTFISELDQGYTVFTSTDFGTAVNARRDVDDSITGLDGETSFVVDFNLYQLPLTDPRRFFVVREND